MARVTRRKPVQGANPGPLSDDPFAPFSYVVVLMLENRSFDNLLGDLYAPGELPPGKSFEGLIGKELSNPIPPGVPTPGRATSVPVLNATNYHDPYPDPGEVYEHVNTQLYNVVSPPFNLPDPLPATAPMTGFVTDYVLNYPADLGNPPTYDQYSVVMACFPRTSVSILSSLARQFAVFDHWFCSVPSQTWCNRAFWHAATSWGHVVNGGGDDQGSLEWLEDSGGKTLFNALADAGLDWRIYSSNFASLTGLIHFRALEDYHFTNFPSLEQFFTDCKMGRLPPYSFIEPNFWTPHNDQHPSSFDSCLYGPAAAGSVLLGENLINRVYDAVRTSSNTRGNNWRNTLLIITHDEHGGCYDHVAPGPAVPPGGFSRHEDGFQFDRLGIRVPMVMVSAHIAPGTIVNAQHEHTSFLKTMAMKWELPALTARDAAAPDFGEVFTSDLAQPASSWPVLADHVVPLQWFTQDFSDAPLNELQRSIVGMVAALPQAQGLALDATAVQTVGDAAALIARVPALPGAHPSTPQRFWRTRRTRLRPH
jgi:phospholipase C